MNGRVLTSVALALAAGLVYGQAPVSAAQETPIAARITGAHALVKRKGRFEETWVHPDASLTRFTNVYLWNVAFQFRNVGRKKSLGASSAILHETGREKYPVPQEAKERFKKVVYDAFVEELHRSKRFELIDEVRDDTLVVRGGVLDIVSWVPPNARIDVYLAAVGEGTIVFELIDPETGLMQARVGERNYIRPPLYARGVFSGPANFNTVWPRVALWARGVASDLRHELEERLKGEKEDERARP